MADAPPLFAAGGGLLTREFPLRALMLLACWLLEACSMVSEPLSHGQTLAQQQARLERVAWPLLVAGAELCGRAAITVYGIELEDAGPGVRVKEIHPRLPAGRAGLQKGDRLLSLDDQDLTLSEPIEVLSIMDKLNRLHITLLEMRLERNGGILEFATEGVPACNYPVLLLSSDMVNALADGKRIALTTGMMRFVRNDAELALVIGHEIAHNALQHRDTIQLKSLLNDLVSAYTGVREPSNSSLPQDLETEADYVALYIIARAGHDVALIANFWSRLDAADRSSSVGQFSRSHPTTEARLLAFEETLIEIQRKRRSEVPLLPDLTHSPK
jgi:hypothetical protein